jgi:hypothetical protein
MLIAKGKCKEAMVTLSAERPEPASLKIQTAFNYGMAEWGATGIPPSDMFRQVLHSAGVNGHLGPDQIVKLGAAKGDANYFECLAVAAIVQGLTDLAMECLATSRRAVRSRFREFSCWRYLRLPSKEFLKDLDEIEQYALGGTEGPRFLRGHSS